MAALRQEAARRPPAAGALAVLGDPVFDAEDARVQGAHAVAKPDSSAMAPRTALVRSLDDVPIAAGGRIPRLLFSLQETIAIAAMVPTGQVAAERHHTFQHIAYSCSESVRSISGLLCFEARS